MKQIKGGWWLVSLFAGIILGTIVTNILEYMAPQALTVFVVDQYVIAAQLVEHQKDWIWYLLRQRGLQILLVAGVGMFSHSVFLPILVLFFCGYVWGMLLSLETMRLGIQGLFLAISCFLPHGICYGGAFVCLFMGKETMRQETKAGGGRRILWLLVMLLLVMGGIGMEIFLSPDLIQWILQ